MPCGGDHYRSVGLQGGSFLRALGDCVRASVGVGTLGAGCSGASPRSTNVPDGKAFERRRFERFVLAGLPRSESLMSVCLSDRYWLGERVGRVRLCVGTLASRVGRSCFKGRRPWMEGGSWMTCLSVKPVVQFEAVGDTRTACGGTSLPSSRAFVVSRRRAVTSAPSRTERSCPERAGSGD